MNGANYEVPHCASYIYIKTEMNLKTLAMVPGRDNFVFVVCKETKAS